MSQHTSTSFVTTDCPTCGPTDIALDRVALVVEEDTGRSFASIHCPRCGARFCRRTDDGMSLLMTTVGVRVVIRNRPAEIDERPAGLPPITEAEAAAFASAVGSADDIVRLAAG